MDHFSLLNQITTRAARLASGHAAFVMVAWMSAVMNNKMRPRVNL
jgi:uncharacterized protein (DUF952 family)